MIKMQIENMQESATEAAELLLAMANPHRLMILCHLFKGENSVTELIEQVGLSQSALSQQLAKLRAMKLVQTRRDGRTIYYRLASGDIEKVLETLYGIYCEPEDVRDSDTRA